MTSPQSHFRIVSIVPSLTETICHFGLEGSLVGCTNFCIEPISLRKSVASVGGTKDASVEKILSLKPTHIITNREENTEALLRALQALSDENGFTVIETFLEFPEDNFELVRQLGATFSFNIEAQRWCAQQLERLSALRNKMTTKASFNFAYFIWMNPWMTAGNQTYISRCLELIGGNNVIATGKDLKERYPSVTASDARIQSSDVLLFSSEPFPFKNRHIETFQGESHRKFRCMKVNGQALSWYGSRFAATLSELESIREKIENL